MSRSVLASASFRAGLASPVAINLDSYISTTFRDPNYADGIHEESRDYHHRGDFAYFLSRFGVISGYHAALSLPGCTRREYNVVWVDHKVHIEGVTFMEAPVGAVGSKVRSNLGISRIARGRNITWEILLPILPIPESIFGASLRCRYRLERNRARGCGRRKERKKEREKGKDSERRGKG